MRTLSLPLLLLAACSSAPQVEQVHTEDPVGRIVVRPMHDGRVAADYDVTVEHGGETVATARTSRDGAALISDLSPGPYVVRVTGAKLKHAKVRVTVKQGRSATITWWLTPPPASGEMTPAERVLVFIVTLPFRLLWAILTSRSDHDDDCRSSGSSSHETRPRNAPQPAKKPTVKW